MCVVRLVDGKAVRQARDTCPDSTTTGEPDSRLEGWRRFPEQEHLPHPVSPDARELARALPSVQSVRAFADLNSLSLGPSCPPFPVDTRGQPRHGGLDLTPADRDNARGLLEAAGQCGCTWLALRGWQDGPGDGFDMRAVVQSHCGTRYCEECSKVIRRHQIQRTLGDWSMFTTHTIPAGIHSKREEWDLIYSAGRVFRREVRRESKRRNETSDAKTWRGEYAHIARQALARMRLRGPEKIEYAWALEPHQDGRPHLHMIWNQEWMSFSWIRRIWSAALGMMDARVDGRRVWSKDGICGYLAKYISKRRMSLDILAIIKGRRTWASTLVAPEEEEPKWWRDESVSQEECGREVENMDDTGAEEGWELVAGKPNMYAIWKRPAEVAPVKVLQSLSKCLNVGTNPSFEKYQTDLMIIRNSVQNILMFYDLPKDTKEHEPGSATDMAA